MGATTSDPGPSRNRHRTSLRRLGHSSGQSVSAGPVAGPSRIVAAATGGYPHHDGILRRLQNGEGIPQAEWDGIVEPCTACSQWFLSRFLHAHILQCPFANA